MSFWHRLGISGILIVLLFLSGCTSINRFEESSKGDEWKTIDDVYKSVEKVEVGKTTLAELDAIHLGPNSPNVWYVTFLTIKQLLDIKEYKPEEALFPKPIEECLLTRERCKMLIIPGGDIPSQGFEDILSRFFLNKKDNKKTGWEVLIKIFLIDDTVVYLEMNTLGNIQERDKRVDPFATLEQIKDKAVEKATDLKVEDLYLRYGF